MYKKILKMENPPEKLINIGEKILFKKNENLYDAGDKIDNVYILVKGKMLVITDYMNGSSIYEFILVPNCVITEMCVVNDIVSPSTFKCIENSEIIKISKDTLEEVLNTDNNITKYLYRVTSNLLYRFMIQAREYATLNAQERIVNILIEFAEEFGHNSNGKIKITYKISQQFISNLVGVKILTTARILKNLKEENIVDYNNGYYYIKDLESLKKYSKSSIIEMWQIYEH